MANSAFTHDPQITVPASSTDNAVVIFDGTAGTGFGNSTILVDSGGNGRIGIAADTDVITLTSGVVTIAGTVAATTLTGAGAGITALNATQLTSGTIPAARIGNDSIDSQHYAPTSIDNEHLADDAVGIAELSATGTASSSTFLRGDNAWAAPAGGPSQANQAALEAETNEDTYAPPDLIKHSPGVAKVWCQWEQTGAHGITGSYNMTSVADGGSAGNTDHLYDTDFSNTNYAIVGMTVDDAYIYHAGSSIATTGITTVSVTAATGSGVDKAWNHIVVFGDQ